MSTRTPRVIADQVNVGDLVQFFSETPNKVAKMDAAYVGIYPVRGIKFTFEDGTSRTVGPIAMVKIVNEDVLKETETRFHETDTLTKTETLKRLRHAAKIVRKARNYPTSWMTEVGTRLIPAYASTEEEARRVVWDNKEDDLDSFDDLIGASRNPQCQGSGYIAHIYFTSGGWEGELVDVVAVWTGTSTIDPVILTR